MHKFESDGEKKWCRRGGVVTPKGPGYNRRKTNQGEAPRFLRCQGRQRSFAPRFARKDACA